MLMGAVFFTSMNHTSASLGFQTEKISRKQRTEHKIEMAGLTIVREKTPPTSSMRATTSYTVCDSGTLARSSTGLFEPGSSGVPLLGSIMSARSSGMGLVQPDDSICRAHVT